MKLDKPPSGGAFLIEECAPDQITTPEELPYEARLMARTVAQVTMREVLPRRERLEAQEAGAMRGLLRHTGDLGLLAIGVPEEYGGLGVTKACQALLTEQMAGGDLSCAITAGVHGGVALLPLLAFGTPEQKRRYLPKLASGELIGAFALSEANAGSDALSARTTAILAPDGAHYLLNGVKSWVTNGGFADIITVFAKVNGTQLTAFLVERNCPGVSFGPEERKMGLRGSSTRQMFLDNVPVPIENIVGTVGQGHKAALCALNLGRLNIGVCALGASKSVLRESVRYAKQRAQFGHSIAEFGLIQHKLGEMAVRAFLLESMAYRTLGYLDQSFRQIDPRLPDADMSFQAVSEEYAMECALVKFFGTEVLGYAADEGLQIHGGYGYCENFPIARIYRDARVFRIFEGTNEVNRLSVMDQLRRRVRTGRLSFGDFGASGNPLSIVSKAMEPADSPLHQVGDCVRRIRRAALYTLEQVWLAQDAAHAAHQETNAAVADMIAALYALESAWLRYQKLAACTDCASAHLAHVAVQIGGYEVCAQVEQWARYALASVSTGGTLAHHAQFVRKLFEDMPVLDTVGLRREIAATVLECDGYPWGP